MRKLLTTTLTALTVLGTATPASAWTRATGLIYSPEHPNDVVQVSNKSFSDPAFGYQAWTHFGKWGTFEAKKGKTYRIIVSNPQYIGDTSPVAGEGLHTAITLWKRPNGPGMEDANLTPDHNFSPTNDYIETGASLQHIQSSGGGGAPTPYGCTDTAERKCDIVTRTLTDADGKSMKITAKTTEFWKAAKRDLSPWTTPGDAPVLLDDGTTEIGQPRMMHIAAVVDDDSYAGGPITNWPALSSSPRLKKVRDKVPGRVVLKFKADEDTRYQFYVGGINPEMPAAQYNGKGKFTVDVMIKGL